MILQLVGHCPQLPSFYQYDTIVFSCDKNHPPLQMPEGKDHSWNFVEIDSASDLMALENPRQSRTQVESEDGESKRRRRAKDEIATKNEFQARVNSTRSGGKEKFRELVRRKKGLRRRVKLARFDNNEETRDKEASAQTTGEENRANDVKSENGEKEIVVMVNHSGPETEKQHQEVSKRGERAKNAKEPFVSNLAEEDLANKERANLPRKAEQRSYGEVEVGRDYYPSGPSDPSDPSGPSGPRREQLLNNERAFLTSVGKGELLNQSQHHRNI